MEHLRAQGIPFIAAWANLLEPAHYWRPSSTFLASSLP